MKSDTVPTVSPSISNEVMVPDAMILVFWMLSFKPTFSLSSLLLIFLPAILTPAYACSSPEFLMMYSAYKLNKQGDNIQPWRTPFPIWNQSVVPRPVLTVASWPAYRFLKRQVRWSGIPISLIGRILFYNCESGERKKSVNKKSNFKGRDTFLRGFPGTSVV